MAAGRVVPNVGDTRREVWIGDDLRQLRTSLNESLGCSSTDIVQAVSIAHTAVKEFVKALAYLAAERIVDNTPSEALCPEVDGWDIYGGTLWPQLFPIFARIPAAGEPVIGQELVEALTVMSELVAEWMVNCVGVRYEINDGGHSCWWEREHY